MANGKWKAFLSALCKYLNYIESVYSRKPFFIILLTARMVDRECVQETKAIAISSSFLQQMKLFC